MLKQFSLKASETEVSDVVSKIRKVILKLLEIVMCYEVQLFHQLEKLKLTL